MTKAERAKFDKEKKALFLDNAESCCGVVTEILKKIGVSYGQYYRWRKEDPVFCEQADEKLNCQLAYVEGELAKLVKAGNATAIIFYLKCHGWREAKDVKVTGPEQFEIKIE